MMSKTAAAFKILQSHKGPMTCEEIIKIALKKGYIETKGKTPANTLRVDISNEIKRNNAKGIKPRFKIGAGAIVELNK